VSARQPVRGLVCVYAHAYKSSQWHGVVCCRRVKWGCCGVCGAYGCKADANRYRGKVPKMGQKVTDGSSAKEKSVKKCDCVRLS
jgi:hypothetical protein